MSQVLSPIKPVSWLLSCHHCQAMLEVADARMGQIFTCGVCGKMMEVVDLDRSLTKAVVATARHDNSASSPASWQPDETDLTPAAPMPIVRGASFILPGFTVNEALDEGIHGQRIRVRDLMGRFYRALVLDSDILRQPRFRERISALVETTNRIGHPVHLPVYRVVDADQSVVLISYDPPDHESLATILARQKTLPLTQAMGILRQLALVLDDAFRQGVVHGWIRPEVVLLGPDESVQLDELSLPKAYPYLLRKRAVSTTAHHYLAPECQDESFHQDLRSDLFLLGALLYRMVTGEGLLVGRTAEEALRRYAASGPPSFDPVKFGAIRDLNEIFHRLVAVDPKNRFSSFHEPIEICDRFSGQTQRRAKQLTNRIGSSGTGSIPRIGSDEITRVGTVNLRRLGTGEIPRSGTGNIRRPGTNEIPRTNTGKILRVGTGPIVAPGTRSLAQSGTGRIKQEGTRALPNVLPTPKKDNNSPRSKTRTSGRRRRETVGLSSAKLLLMLSSIVVITALAVWFLVLKKA